MSNKAKTGGSLSGVLTDNSEAHSAIRERRQKADAVRDTKREFPSRIQLRVTHEMRGEIKALAALSDMSVDALSRKIFAEYLKKADAKSKRSKR